MKTTAPTAPTAPAEPEVTYTPGANGTQIGSDGTVIGPIKSGVATGGASTPAFTNNTPSTPVTTTTQVEPQTIHQLMRTLWLQLHRMWHGNGQHKAT